jgi:hypothetical protein
MKILSAERSRDRLIIVFDDGETAAYPASLLYACLPQITEVIHGDGPEELEEE